MANPSKQKGTRAETKVVKFGESYGFGLRRKALTGSKDEGDVELFDAPRLANPITIEVKAGKQTANPNRTQLTKWLKQREKEEENSGQRCVLCVVRYNRSIKDADVYNVYRDGYGETVREHMYLDEFFELYR